MHIVVKKAQEATYDVTIYIMKQNELIYLHKKKTLPTNMLNYK